MLGRSQSPNGTSAVKTRGGWQKTARRKAYVCVDGLSVEIASKGLRPCQWSDSFRNTTRTAPTNTVGLCISKQYRLRWIQLFVSETEFDRSMSRIVRGSRGSKTITFPSTARSVLECAFQGTPLRSVILNEGLRELGELESNANY